MLPFSVNFAISSGVWAAFTNSRFSLSTMAVGVPAGANTPAQSATLCAPSPASIKVGMSGSAGSRVSASTASALAIVLCVAVFGAILLQKASIRVPASAPPQATPTESRAPTVADSAAESAVAAPERRQLAQPSAASAEKRIALVIGNVRYQVGALTTPANDAGLIAQTLQAAGDRKSTRLNSS